MADLLNFSNALTGVPVAVDAKVMGTVDLFTIPVGKKFLLTGFQIIKTLYNQGGQTQSATFNVGTDSPDFKNFADNFSTSDQNLYDLWILSGGSGNFSWDGRVIFNAGDIVKINITIPSDADDESYTFQPIGRYI